jgi:hypothetical protein
MGSVTSYRYDLVLYREDGEPLREAPFKPDWEPAIEWARFAALRSGRLPAGASDEAISIAPVWDEEAGEPFVSGFIVHVATNGVRSASEFPLSYFRDAAQQTSDLLVQEGTLRKGDRFLFRTRAAREGKDAGAERPGRLRATVSRLPFPAVEGSLEEFVRGASPASDAEPVDFPLFVREHVVAEAARLAVRAAEAGTETAGMLVGRLRLDRGAPEAFVEITDQFPARHTVEETHRLVFTAETWSDAHETLAARHPGKVLVGWHHLHPVRAWCRECNEEKRETCPYTGGFFSEQDRLVHRTAFPASYHVAMVLTDLGEASPDVSFFGWRRGTIARREARLLAAPAEGRARAGGREEPRSKP